MYCSAKQSRHEQGDHGIRDLAMNHTEQPPAAYASAMLARILSTTCVVRHMLAVPPRPHPRVIVLHPDAG